MRLETDLENARGWPRYFLSLSYECPLADPAETHQRYFVPYLGGGDTRALASAVRCHRRGQHHFGPVTVESKAPFGLFRRRVRLPSPLSVLVYPQVYPLARLPLMESAEGTAARPRAVREGQEIAGSRRYVPGDPLRHIHWRNTARAGRPMVKEFEDSQENTLVIVFDSSRELGQGQETTLEYSIKLAASVAGYVVGRGRSIRLLTGTLVGEELPWEHLLKELALLEAGHGPGLATLLESAPAASRVLALVSDADSAGLEALWRLGGQTSGLAVVVLEGFGDGASQPAGASLDSMRRSGVPVIGCVPGRLESTLRTLEQVDWSTGRKRHAARATGTGGVP